MYLSEAQEGDQGFSVVHCFCQQGETKSLTLLWWKTDLIREQRTLVTGLSSEHIHLKYGTPGANQQDGKIKIS